MKIISIEERKKRKYERLKKYRQTPQGKETRRREHQKFYKKYKEKYKEYKQFLYNLRLEWGGRCSLCGYNKQITILHFHHLQDKKFQVCEYRGIITEKVKARIREEAKKCILLCPNCHAEIHYAKNN